MRTPEDTYAEVLAHFASTQSPHSIPPDVLHAAKLLILDNVGLALAGHSQPSARLVAEVVIAEGGPGPATVVGSGERLPMRSAALVNGTLAESLEYGDTHRVRAGKGTAIHPGMCVIPCALAAAEARGARGSDLLVATVVGLEVAVRVAQVAPNRLFEAGWHITGVCAGFGAAATASVLMGATPEQAAQAIGMCVSLAAGTMEYEHDGSWVKQLHVGWQAGAGLLAAQLAVKGFTGPRTAFEGHAGLFRTHLDEPFDFDALSRGLGSTWETLAVLPRAYPLCNVSGPFIEAAIALKREHGIDLDAIEEVTCDIASESVALICEPAEVKRRPPTPYGAKYSLPYAVGLALVHERIEVADFTTERFPDPRVSDLAERVTYRAEPGRYVESGRVTIALRDGTRHTHEIPAKKGTLQNPMSEAEIVAKFGDNARLSATAEEADRIRDLVLGLDGIDDVAARLSPALVTSLAPAPVAATA